MVNDVLTAKRYKDERYIAYIAVEKIKNASSILESDDPSHKNGIKFSISKQRYNDIIETVFDERCAKHMSRDLIKVVIDSKLKKL